jgi:hypothetical protein
MAEVLYAPSREQVVTTNAWAFLHWLQTTRGLSLAGWAALQQWSAEQQAAFEGAVQAFCRGSTPPPPLAGQGWGVEDTLLFGDLRPDDKPLIITSDHADPLDQAAEMSASVLIAPARAIAEATFPRQRRLDLSELRTIIATGAPMSPEARRRIYTWVKADVMLLARSSDTFWGNPLEPVLAQPPATPAFATPRPSVPATR